MSFAADSQANSQPDSGAGYCTQWSEEELDRIEREWAESAGPQAPAPPMANVHLAVELTTGLDAVRDFDFQGRTLRLKPTPYPTAIRLLAWMQQLERLEAMGELLAEHLPELRDCYQEIANLASTLVIHRASWWIRLLQRLRWPRPLNPFLEANPLDFHRVIAFVLSTGNEQEIRQPRPTGVSQRYDATYYLYRYLAAFGAIPGMVILDNGRPQPASWRHFAQAMNYQRREGAETALQWFGAMASAQHGGDGAEKWVAGQTEAIGQDG